MRPKESVLPSFLLPGLSDIADRYDAFILDLWGVLHDGCNAYPDTIETLKKLKTAGKKTVLLSNAPRRNPVIVEKLDGMGIARDLYTDIMTSGEATWRALAKDFAGKKIFFIGQKHKDNSLYEGFSATITDAPEEADVMLVTGVEDFSDKAELYAERLKRARATNLTFICANPDRIVHVGEQLVVCAGTLADIYESMGGKVLWFGKPYPAVYDSAFDLLGHPPKSRVAAVGDSMVTDIAGAHGAGIDSYLVTAGIHREELAGEADIPAFLEKAAFRPTGFLPVFKW